MNARHRTVLVLAQDAVVAALVGLLLEGAGFAPAFAAAEETSEDALARVRPIYALLLDGADAAHRSDILLARAERMGVRVALFGANHASAEIRDWAAQRGVPLILLPTSALRLQLILEEADRSSRARRVGERRDPQREGDAPDAGAMTFADAQGRTWRVFDRRGSERRASDDRRAGFRTFVCERERRECAMSEADFAESSPLALARQFARALPLR